ncbi:unnamed protein product, partial [Oncorhynchus mykiss]
NWVVDNYCHIVYTGDSHLGGGLEANSSTESFELVTEDNNGGKQAAEVPLTEDEWVPLELCFGMPLFSSELNRKICRKIAAHGLCSKDSLQDLLHSSRTLSLNVLSFVQSFQVRAAFYCITPCCHLKSSQIKPANRNRTL